MDDNSANLWNRVQSLSAGRRATIAFGLQAPNKDILDGLRDCQAFVDIVLVTPPLSELIPGFELIPSAEPERQLASLLVSKGVEGIVRGTLDDKRTLNAYMALTGEKDTYCPTLIEDGLGRQYFIAPVSNSDGWTCQQRLAEASAIAGFMREWGFSPRISVYSAIRHDTRKALADSEDPTDKQLCSTYDDALRIVAGLQEDGFEARNNTIEFNVAVAEGYNLHICVNGIVGNQVGRAIMSSGGKMLTCTRIGLSHVYEDNSRTQTDFRSHVRWASALVNARYQTRGK